MKKYIYLFLGLIFSSCSTEEPIPTYTLAVSVSPAEAGKITISPQSPDYKEGEMVTLTAVPNEHWVFKQWEGDGSGSSSPLQITMSSNKSVVGVFVKRDYPLTLTITGEGTVEEKIVPNPGGREYPHGTTVELTPKPKEGWVFESWGGDLTGTESPKTIKVDKEKNVTVKFKRRDYPLNITITGEGTVEDKIIINPGGKSYPFETVVELTPKPKEGWVFESWGGDLTGTESPKTIKVDKEKNVTVKFIRNQTVTALNCSNATNNGTLTSGVAVTGGVNIIIPYTGAFGGTHNGQTVTSTGVTGLTATLAAGTFANGSGNLTYTITGTPSAVGTASFGINIGGKTCNINRTVTVAFTFVEVISNTGKIWMDRNLGATRAATSRTDLESYGDLYQWGRRADGHQLRNSQVISGSSTTDQPAHGSFIATSTSADWRIPQNDNLWQGVNGVNNPCPSGYRIPTEAEWEAERLSWPGGSRAAGAFASPLKLPLAGSRVRSNGSLTGLGQYGNYWSSTVKAFVSSSIKGADVLYLDSDNAGTATLRRSEAFSVRCIKN